MTARQPTNVIPFNALGYESHFGSGRPDSELNIKGAGLALAGATAADLVEVTRGLAEELRRAQERYQVDLTEAVRAAEQIEVGMRKFLGMDIWENANHDHINAVGHGVPGALGVVVSRP